MKAAHQGYQIILQMLWGLAMCWYYAFDVATGLRVAECEIMSDGFVGSPDPASERTHCHPVAAGFEKDHQLYAFFFLAVLFLIVLGCLFFYAKKKNKSYPYIPYVTFFTLPFLFLGFWLGQDYYPMSDYYKWGSLLFPFLAFTTKRSHSP